MTMQTSIDNKKSIFFIIIH